VVLYEPQKPVNIAATVRAMKNMGVRDLRLVRRARTRRTSSRSSPRHARRGRAHPTLRHARRRARRLRARGRVHRPPAAAKWARATPREAAADLAEHAEAGPVAVLFGPRGRRACRATRWTGRSSPVTIPTTEHMSLNVAQAVLVALYELHLAAGDATRTVGRWRKHAGPAPAAASEEYFRDAERALVALDFFKTRNPEHVMRSVRSLTYRAAPDARELGLMRAMAFEVLRTVEREAARARAEGYAAGLDAGRAAADV
jgi:tRNA C32,U32 (ribose-2'-O)-methylase TrmJ